MAEIRRMKPLLYLFLLPIFAACNAATAATTPEEFTAEMYERFVAAKPTLQLEIKADLELLITGDQLGDGVINLHRIYGFCQQASPEDCTIAKQELVDSLTPPIPDSELRSLRIIVRDQEYFDYLDGNSGIKNVDISLIPHRKIGEDLYAFLAFDSLSTISLATKEALQDFDIEEQEAWDLAENQTREILPAFPTSEQLRANPIALESGEYLASLLAFQDDWVKLSNEVGERLFVTAVSDQSVMAALDSSIYDLAALKRSVADDCLQQQRCISPNVYRFSEGQWMMDR